MLLEFLTNNGIPEEDIRDLDQDELCELAIHMLHPTDLDEFIAVFNSL